MVKKKTTKEIRAIDRIIKFQIDDGIESLTIAGKDALADLEIDNKNNVTLYLNADGDKINELTSLVPFINLSVKEEGVDPDKQKSVTLSQDLTQFALEIADNSTELASLIKSESSIILDLEGLVQKLLEIAGKLAELEAKNLEQDNRLTDIEEKDLEQDNRLTELENNEQPQEQLYNVSTNTVVNTFSEGANSFKIIVDEKNGDNNVFGYITVMYNNQNILDTIPLSQVDLNSLFIVDGNRQIYFITRTDTGYVIETGVKERILAFSSLGSITVNSVLFRENPNKENKHNIEIIEINQQSKVK